jgi:hypothetical protein
MVLVKNGHKSYYNMANFWRLFSKYGEFIFFSLTLLGPILKKKKLDSQTHLPHKFEKKKHAVEGPHSFFLECLTELRLGS